MRRDVLSSIRSRLGLRGWGIRAGFGEVRRRLHGIRQRQILSLLESCSSKAPSILFVHSSLSACGYIVDGPAAVIGALRRWTYGRTLVLPTHTYCYPDQDGNREIFDPAKTASRVGVISNYFWQQPGATRSLHPTHSLAAIGPEQEELCARHDTCGTPCGRGTPYERLIERDAAVLMFGATMNTYTLFHTAEDATDVPYLYEETPYELLVKSPNATTKIVRMRRHDMSVLRRFEQMADWLEEREALIRSPLGTGELLYIPSSARVHQLVTEEMAKEPYFLVAPEARPVAAAAI